MKLLKSKYLILIPSFLLLFIGCESSIINEDDSISQLESENLPEVTQKVTDADLNKTLAGVRSSTAHYQNVENSEEVGYHQESPFVPNMGYHYVNFNLLDGTINPTEPEALVYVDNPKHDDKRNLVAVEYVIPGNLIEERSELDGKFPNVNNDQWHFDEQIGPFGSWTLHAWIWYPNPEGIFHPTNPRVGS